MEKLKWQEKLYNAEWDGDDVSTILTEEEFLSICNGKGFRAWDDNYFCIIEQQLGEVLDGRN